MLFIFSLSFDTLRTPKPVSSKSCIQYEHRVRNRCFRAFSSARLIPAMGPLRMCHFAYLLKFVGAPEWTLKSFSCLQTVVYRRACAQSSEKMEFGTRVPDEVEQGDTLLSHFRSTKNKYPFYSLFSAMCFTFLFCCFCQWFCCLNGSAASWPVLCSIPKPKVSMRCLAEKLHVLGKLHSDTLQCSWLWVQR